MQAKPKPWERSAEERRKAQHNPIRGAILDMYGPMEPVPFLRKEFAP
jgi:hypothetical protein